MPLYEYQCQACGRTEEVMQSFSDPPLSTCEACGGALKKLLSPPAVQFKGSGWYVSDYARKTAPSEKKGAEASPSSESKTAADSKPAAETKPAASDGGAGEKKPG